jgi:hypothetical protein
VWRARSNTGFVNHCDRTMPRNSPPAVRPLDGPRAWLDAGEARERPMTTTDWIAVFAAVVSFGSMVAAIVSARNAGTNARTAERAVEQAKQTALLGPRTEAIDRLREAMSALQAGRGISPGGIKSMREAKARADLASFSKGVKDELDRLIGTVEGTSQVFEELPLGAYRLGRRPFSLLHTPLQKDLIERMNDEATLR